MSDAERRARERSALADPHDEIAALAAEAADRRAKGDPLSVYHGRWVQVMGAVMHYAGRLADHDRDWLMFSTLWELSDVDPTGDGGVAVERRRPPDGGLILVSRACVLDLSDCPWGQRSDDTVPVRGNGSLLRYQRRD